MSSLRRTNVGSMPMSVAFKPETWTWLRLRKQGGNFNVSEFVDRAVGREIRHMDAAYSSEKTMLDALDRDQLITYTMRCLTKIQIAVESDEEFNHIGSILTMVKNLREIEISEEE